MKLSDLKQILAEEEVRLTKSLGQNFLHDANQLRRIVEAAELRKSDRVLEIGPGLGPLTELLLEQAGTVLAIETDARLVKLLQRRIQPTERLRLIHDDALEYLRREPTDWSGWKVVANLPYSVASRILVELAQAEGRPERMVVTLQLEVARRLVAAAGDSDYGVLTLLVQLAYEPRGWFKIPAGCFFPEPKVDSACVCLVRRAQPWLQATQEPVFARIVKLSFSQRRKMMMKLLKADWKNEQLLHAFAVARLARDVRAETVTLEQFVSLTRALSPEAER